MFSFSSMAGKGDKKANNRKKVNLLTSIFIIGFFLNLIWENAQAFMYKGFTGFYQHFMICFWASLGDAAVILLFAALVSSWHKSLNWITNLKWEEVLVLMIFGGAVAVIFELWALEFGVWEYNNKMPVVPYLHIGVFPLLQMIILPALTVYFTGIFFKPHRGNGEAHRE